jgi:DNA-binding transcriptional regulator/RsmH inhibitor MraZ
VEVGPYFGGNALATVDSAGRVRLPLFVRETLAGRTEGRRIVFGAHESAACLSGYEPAYRAAFLDRNGSRRIFGFAEEAEFDARGRVTLPHMMRWKARIGLLALFIGTGGAFEVWNPELALEAGDPDLRQMAEYRLHIGSMEKEEAR